MVSLDNLKAVSAMFENDCQTMQQIIDGTGLDKSTVMACVKWLTDNGLLSVSKSKKFYCTIDNVSAMQNQFKMCQKCFSK
jgi:DNA-binding IclR family transcriptional regulator